MIVEIGDKSYKTKGRVIVIYTDGRKEVFNSTFADFLILNKNAVQSVSIYKEPINHLN